jgi:hypothetical protein
MEIEDGGFGLGSQASTRSDLAGENTEKIFVKMRFDSLYNFATIGWLLLYEVSLAFLK